MSERVKLDTVDCPKCNAKVDVYPFTSPGEPLIGSNTRDQNHCKAPSLATCRDILAEIELRFPGHLPRMA
jgi:hypothetical protein